MKKINSTALLILSSIIFGANSLSAEILCKNRSSGAIISRPKSCKRNESAVQTIGLAVKSTKATANNTTGIDLSVTRLNGTGGTLNNTGMNLSVIGDTGGDSTNVGLFVNTAGADTNYSALFSGGNVGINVSDPDEALELAGRFHLGQSSSPSNVSDKLYNLGGTLYWSGQAVAVGSIPSGTISQVIAGSGLSGGGSSGSVTLSVNTGTSADNIVKLNSSAELPIVSGVNLTNLSASNIGSGTLSDSRLSSNVSKLGSAVGLTAEVEGILPIANGGTGAATLSNLMTLGTHTTGSYVESVATGTGLTGGAAGSESAALTLSLDQTVSPTWSGSHSFTGNTNFGTSSSSVEKLHLNGRLHMEQSSAPTVTTDKLYNVSGDLFFNGKNLSTNAAGGDITSVVAGNGITSGSGGTTGDVTIAVDTGTTANKIVQLDGSAQLPTVSGINLTNLNASNLSSGTISSGLLPSTVSLLGTAVSLASEVEGTLPIANGGIGATSLNNLITLSTHTTGNYVTSISAGTGITVAGTASEGGTPSISFDPTVAFTWTGAHTYSGVTTDITTASNENFVIKPNGIGKVGIGTNTPTAMLDSTMTSTATSGATEVGAAVNLTDTGAITTGTDLTIGSDINVTRTGASGTASLSTTGLDVSVTADTGGTSTATGLNVSVSGADTNYAALFSGGKVGIGISNPSSQFETYASYAPAVASSQIANQFNVANSGALSSGTDVTKGMYLSVARTNATGTASPTTTGLDIVVTDDAGGTSQTTGLSVAVSGGDKNVAATFSGGSVSVGGSSVITDTDIPSGSLVVDSGALCVDNGGDDCGTTTRTRGTIYAVNTTVTGVDLAEEFPIEKDDVVEAGDIVIANTKVAAKCVAFGLDNSGTKICTEEKNGFVPFVTKTSGIDSENKKILGVISTKPGFKLGGFGQDELIFYRTVPLTLAGRVPVKVTLENGAIEVGDRIAPSTKAGFGRKANDGEVSIGIALEPFSDEISIDTDKVLVLVK
jgi:hypothetical protein